MPKHINLRQIEAFKAVIENGTVSRAAELLNISQPAMSKLIAHLEYDTGLKLFDRVKGRLAPSANAMRLYDEVGRIFAGVRQVENALEAIRREDKERLAIGVLPALAGAFIQRSTMRFLERRRNVFCDVQSLGSQWIVDGVVTRKLDIGLVNHAVDNPYVVLEPLMEHPLVCLMSPDHALASKDVVRPKDLDRLPFIGFSEIDVGNVVTKMFRDFDVHPQIVLISNVAQTACEFVAAGLGVNLAHPLYMSGLEHRLVAKRFEPVIPYAFQLCYNVDSRNMQHVEAFAEHVRAVAAQISESIE